MNRLILDLKHLITLFPLPHWKLLRVIPENVSESVVIAAIIYVSKEVAITLLFLEHQQGGLLRRTKGRRCRFHRSSVQCSPSTQSLLFRLEKAQSDNPKSVVVSSTVRTSVTIRNSQTLCMYRKHSLLFHLLLRSVQDHQ